MTDVDNIPCTKFAPLSIYCAPVAFALLVPGPELWEDNLITACE